MLDGSDPAPKGWVPRHELERPPAAEAVADAVGLRRHLPGVGEEIAARFFGDPVPVEAGDDAEFRRLAGHAAEVLGHGAAFALAGARADRQLVAGLERPALVAAERTERVGRAAAEHDRHVDAAGDGEIGAGAGLEEVEGKHVALLHGEGRPVVAGFAVDLGRHRRAGDGDGRIRR